MLSGEASHCISMVTQKYKSNYEQYAKGNHMAQFVIVKVFCQVVKVLHLPAIFNWCVCISLCIVCSGSMLLTSKTALNTACDYRLGLSKELCSVVRWQRSPSGSHQAYFQILFLWSSKPPLLITLPSLAYCLIQSQTSPYILHVSTHLSYVRIKHTRIQQTDESVKQTAVTFEHLDRKCSFAFSQSP